MADLQIRASVDSAQATVGIGKVSGGLGMLGQQLQQLKGIALGYVSVSGLYNMAKETLAWANNTQTLSEQIGVSTDNLQGLQYVAIRNNVEWATFEQMLRRMRVSLDDAASGVGRADKIWAKLGLTQKEMGNADMMKGIMAFAMAVKENDAAKLTAMFDVLGTKVGPRVVGMLRNISEADLSNLISQLKDVGAIGADAMIQRLADADQAIKEFKQRATVYFGEIMSNWMKLGSAMAHPIRGLQQMAPANIPAILDRFVTNAAAQPRSMADAFTMSGVLKVMTAWTDAVRGGGDATDATTAAITASARELAAQSAAADVAAKAWDHYAASLQSKDPEVALRATTGAYEDQLTVIARLKAELNDLTAAQAKQARDAAQQRLEDKSALEKIDAAMARGPTGASIKRERSLIQNRIEGNQYGQVTDLQKAADLRSRIATEESKLTPLQIAQAEAKRHLKEALDKIAKSEEEYAVSKAIAYEQELYYESRVLALQMEINEQKKKGAESPETRGQLLDAQKNLDKLRETRDKNLSDERFKDEQERRKAIADAADEIAKIKRETTGEQVQMRGGPWASAGGWQSQASLGARDASRTVAATEKVATYMATLPADVASAIAAELAKRGIGTASYE